MTDAELLEQARQRRAETAAELRAVSARADAAAELHQALCPHLRQKYEIHKYVPSVTRCLDCNLNDYTEAARRALDHARWHDGARYV